MRNYHKLMVAIVAIFALALISSQAANAADKVYTVDELKAEAMNAVRNLQPAEAKAMIENGDIAVIIDVRDGGEVAGGYIPGSVHISRGTLEFKIEKELPDVAKDAPILIYCKKGARGALSIVQLDKLGYTNLYNLSGGWLQWKEAGYPATQ